MSNLSLHEYWKLIGPVIDHVAIGEEDNRTVGGEKDEDVPDSMKVGEADTGPVGTEEPVVDPGHQGHADDADAPLAEVDDPHVDLCAELHDHEGDAGDCQQHQTEGVHSLTERCISAMNSVSMASNLFYILKKAKQFCRNRSK